MTPAAADSSSDTWAAVDRLVEELLVPGDDALTAALAAADEAGLPPHAVSPAQGRFLQLLARAIRAERVLEVGTLAGYSTIWLARALPSRGRLTTLEVDPRAVEVATANLERAGVAHLVDVVVGPAAETLPGLAGGPPYDLVFLDADKRSSVTYLEWAVRLSRSGAVVVADNVVRGGAVVDADSDDESVQGVRALLAAMRDHPRLDATALQTVGGKGYDGFALALVTE